AGGALSGAVFTATLAELENRRATAFGPRPGAGVGTAFASRAANSRVRLRPGSPACNGCDLTGVAGMEGAGGVGAPDAAIFLTAGLRGGWGGEPGS
ncbi:MAG: hypothetical protein M3O46_13395, partial [Myxococcota bacterium]|nr:hypothetical protein [Myxococcota bacterium]